MEGFEPWTSGVRGYRSTSCATTTAHDEWYVFLCNDFDKMFLLNLNNDTDMDVLNCNEVSFVVVVATYASKCPVTWATIEPCLRLSNFVTDIIWITSIY